MLKVPYWARRVDGCVMGGEFTSRSSRSPCKAWNCGDGRLGWSLILRWLSISVVRSSATVPSKVVVAVWGLQHEKHMTAIPQSCRWHIESNSYTHSDHCRWQRIRVDIDQCACVGFGLSWERTYWDWTWLEQFGISNKETFSLLTTSEEQYLHLIWFRSWRYWYSLYSM